MGGPNTVSQDERGPNTPHIHQAFVLTQCIKQLTCDTVLELGWAGHELMPLGHIGNFIMLGNALIMHTCGPPIKCNTCLVQQGHCWLGNGASDCCLASRVD